MSTREAVKDRLTLLIHEVTEIPLDQITEEAAVDNELQMQSVIFVELQMAIEDEYRIEVDPIRLVELNRFGAIVDYVFEKSLGGAR